MSAVRTIAASHDWVPDEVQRAAVQHLTTHYSAGLPLLPGFGKTSITLSAFAELHAAGKVRNMLVIAPLRVCRQVWRQEGAKWSHLRHLDFVLLHGAKKKEALVAGLKAQAHVFLINPEGVGWLCDQYFGRPLPFDVLCIDELRRFKNAQSQRSKSLRPRTERIPYRWGLTGSLAPNGYMDLFGQQLVLDSGAALGRYITHYRDTYFQCGFDGFSYELLPGADQRIVDKLAPTWFQYPDEALLKLPPLVTNPIMLDMEPKARTAYDAMKRDMVAALPEGVITAANAGAVYSKLAQMANGAVYREDGAWIDLHEVKLDALEELVEELAGAPLLVAYEFNHDLERIRGRLGKDVPYLGSGTTARQEADWIAAWNRGELPVLLAHPASAGHGLNLQGSAAANVAWFGVTWDFELYDQFIRRLRRRGNEAQRIFNHLLMVRGTIDELKLAALGEKDMTQQSLFAALNAAISNEAKGAFMVSKLSRQDGGGQQGGAPKGWGGAGAAQGDGGGQEHHAQQNGASGAPRGWGGAPQGGQDDARAQRERINEQIQPREDVRGAFTAAIQQQADAVRGGDYGPSEGQGGAPQGWGQGAAAQQNGAPQGWGGQQAPQPPFDPGTQPVADKPKRSRAKAAPAEPEASQSGPVMAIAAMAPDPATVRLEVLKAVIASSPDADVQDLLEVSAELAKWVLEG